MFFLRAYAGEASQIKCKCIGKKQVRLGEKFSGDILVSVTDKHGNEIKKVDFLPSILRLFKICCMLNSRSLYNKCLVTKMPIVTQLLCFDKTNNTDVSFYCCSWKRVY